MQVSDTPAVRTKLRQPRLSPTQSAILNLLVAKEMAGDTPPQVKSAIAFYRARDFQPAWSGGAAQEEMAREIQDILAMAHTHGLNDEDYKLPSDEFRSKRGADVAKFDIALTAALLRYASDVRNGRIKPGSVFDDVGLPQSDFDTAAELNKALKAHALVKFLADLPPPQAQYRQLALALAYYRSISDQGGWTEIPGPAPIRLDGKDKRLPLLIKRLGYEDPELADNAKPSPAELLQAVKRFQGRNGLEAQGNVGRETLAALNVPADLRVAQIEANMERWRWMPRQLENRYIAVNVPDQSAEYVKDGEVMLSSKVVVGRKASPTPIARATIVAAVVNPPWNIPGYIAARDLLPHLRRNANYLAAKNMVIMDGPPGDPHGRTIDWRKVQPATFPYAIRQLAGPATALGALMLDSPNDFDVYLHDTPNKKLFTLDDREISNGCVRVQQIMPLASLALTGDADAGMDMINQAIGTHQTQRIELSEPLPVYFLYWTALTGPDGKIQFRPDRNGRDTKLMAALTHTDSGKKAKTDSSAPQEDEDVTP